MSKITLDAETFKALASATRLTVLKALDERRKTLTELSRDLELNKATVHEHLGLLLAAGLVRKRDDEGRKWIYYELTWTGQKILRPEATTTFNVLLGLSVLAAGGGFFMLGKALDWWLSSPTGGPLPDAGGPETLSAPAGDTSGTQSQTASQTGAPGAESSRLALDAPSDSSGGALPFLEDGGWIALALLTAFVVFCGLAWFLHRRLRPAPFDPESAAAADGNPTG